MSHGLGLHLSVFLKLSPRSGVRTHVLKKPVDSKSNAVIIRLWGTVLLIGINEIKIAISQISKKKFIVSGII